MPEPQLELVYLARHAQTEWNRLGRRQGQLDSALTPDGLQQASRLAAVVAALPVDSVFASPLGRATATAEVLAQGLGMTVAVLEELTEVHHGRMAGLTASEVELAYPGELTRRSADKYVWRFPGGESYLDADARAAAALQRIGVLGVKRPLVVSHAMIGRMLLRNLLDLEPEVALNWDQSHDVIFEVDVARRTVAAVPGTGDSR
ncbi:MAG: histidine phosphatase family protein [Acidimicrobiales bacterium]